MHEPTMNLDLLNEPSYQTSNEQYDFRLSMYQTK
jgi:hypothetical protein